MTRLLALLFLFCLAAVPGTPCRGEETKPAAAEIHVATVAGLDAAVARHRGSVVVVNFWATWCKPCVKEMPILAQFARDAQKSGKAVLLGFSADGKEAVQSAVRPFVAKHALPFPTYVIDMGDDPDAVIRHFGDAFTGVLPTTLVYNREGVVAGSHVGEIDRATLDRLVKAAGGS